jgi:hypothetical protein
MRTGIVVVSALLATAVAERVAWADPAEAQDFAARAMKRAAEGDRRGAIDFLEKAYDADPSPDYLLQIADEYDAMASEDGEPLALRLALSHLREYLAFERNPTQVQAVKTRMQALRDRLASMPARTPPRAVVAAPPTPGRRPRTEVAVSFLPVDGADSFRVSVGGKACTAPCTLQLLPGFYQLETSGADQLRMDLNVPDTPGTVHLVQSGNKYFAPGVVLTVLGPLVAASLWAVSVACPLDATTGTQDQTCVTANQVVWPIVGAGMLFTGIGLLAYYGNHVVTKASVEVASDDPPAGGVPRLQFASAGFQPMHNGGAGGVSFSF